MLEDYVLNVGALTIKCSVTYTTKSTYLKLSVKDGAVNVTAPTFLPQQTVIEFIHHKQKWIYKRYQQELIKQEQLKSYWPEELISGVKIPFAGELFQLVFNFEKNQVQSNLMINYEVSQLYLTLALRCLGNQKAIKKILYLELSKALEEKVMKLVGRYEPLIERKPNLIKIKRLKSLWGSCTSGSNIAINWSLIYAPDFVLEYIVVHEMCHLRYLNHGKRFWGLVERLLPDYGVSEAWLKEHNWILEHRL